MPTDDRKQRQREYMKAFTAKWLALGKCPSCCKNDVRTGKTKCQECADKNVAYQKKYREDAKANGICTRCRSQPADSDTQYCADCRQYHTATAQRRAKAKGQEGLCPRCGNEPHADGHKLCATCMTSIREDTAKRTAFRMEQGICCKCGKQPGLPGVQRCQDCTDKDDDNAYRKKYGVTLNQVRNARDQQHGLCLLCCNPLNHDFVVDHCHTNMVVRGLLCQRCNLTLGVYEAETLPNIDRINAYLRGDLTPPCLKELYNAPPHHHLSQNHSTPGLTDLTHRTTAPQEESNPS